MTTRAIRFPKSPSRSVFWLIINFNNPYGIQKSSSFHQIIVCKCTNCRHVNILILCYVFYRQVYSRRPWHRIHRYRRYVFMCYKSTPEGFQIVLNFCNIFNSSSVFLLCQRGVFTAVLLSMSQRIIITRYTLFFCHGSINCKYT